MRIDVWSDVVCPWCWLGKARLQKAIANLAGAGEVQVTFRSFELDPRAPLDLDIPSDEAVARKYGMGRAQLEAIHQRMRGLGEAEGIEYRFERSRTSNTFNAHQLIHLAAANGKQDAMVERLFRAQFSEGVCGGDRSELVRLGAEVGLDEVEIRAALESQRYAEQVRRDEKLAQSQGITGVPFFLIDGLVGVSGAQPVEVLKRVMEDSGALTRAGGDGPP